MKAQAADTNAIAPDRMQAIYDEVKTPFKYGVVLEPPAGKKVDCPNVFRQGDKWVMFYFSAFWKPGAFDTFAASRERRIRLPLTLIREKPMPDKLTAGEMAEWFKAHAWKACVGNTTVSSNLTLSATSTFGPRNIMPLPKPCEMLIENTTMELPDTKTLKIKWPDGYDTEFKTGHFITVYWPDTPTYKRAYSLSSCALDRGFFEVTIKREGKMGTRMVDWAKPGDKLVVGPPVGKFLPDYAPEKHLICVAGGSGITPFRGFAREAAKRSLVTKITIIYSVRTTNDIIFNTEFLELAQQNPNFKFLVTCTRLEPTDPWPGRRGRIDAAFLKQQIGDLANTIFYCCGPTSLVDGTDKLVTGEMGVPKAQMILEKWG